METSQGGAGILEEAGSAMCPPGHPRVAPPRLPRPQQEGWGPSTPTAEKQPSTQGLANLAMEERNRGGRGSVPGSLEQRLAGEGEGGHSGPDGQGHSPICFLWPQTQTAGPSLRLLPRIPWPYVNRGEPTSSQCPVKPEPSGREQSCAASLPLWPDFHLVPRAAVAAMVTTQTGEVPEAAQGRTRGGELRPEGLRAGLVWERRGAGWWCWEPLPLAGQVLHTDSV